MLRKLSIRRLFKRIRQVKSHELAAWVAALAVSGGVFVSIWQHNQTKKLLEPTERPNLQIWFSEKTKENVKDHKGTVLSEVAAIIKNQGKHPASNIRVCMGSAPVEEPSAFRPREEPSDYVNSLSSDNFFALNLPFRKETLREKTQKWLENEDYRKIEHLVYIYVLYKDEFQKEKEFLLEIWAKYRFGDESLSMASQKEKDSVESYVYEVFPRIKEFRNKHKLK